MPMPRNPKNWCLICDSFCRGSQSNLCNECWRHKARDKFSIKTKGDFSANNSRHRYQAIRHHAQRVLSLEGRVRICQSPGCKYDKHVELSSCSGYC